MANATYARPLGSMTVTVINDGTLQGAFEIVTGIDAAAAEQQEKAMSRRVPPVLTINTFLVDPGNGGKLSLIDTGGAGIMGPNAGRLPAGLAALGVAPESIGTVLITHLHPDHAAGLIDAHGAAAFPSAELVVAEAELAFWRDDSIMAAAGEGGRAYFEGARAAIAPYAGRLRPTTAGATVAPGITAVDLSGHTPGHTGYRLSSGDEDLLIWGDIVHLPGIQFARPEAGVAFDVNGDAARATRARVFDMAATDRLLVAGMHLDFPAFGYIARAAEGYAFVPDVWRL